MRGQNVGVKITQRKNTTTRLNDAMGLREKSIMRYSINKTTLALSADISMMQQKIKGDYMSIIAMFPVIYANFYAVRVTLV